MSDHLLYAPAAVRARVIELGGDRFLAALSSLVDEQEEFAVCWFDAKYDDEQADEVQGWSVDDVAAFGETVAYVKLSLELTVWPWPDTDDDDDDESPMSIVAIPAFARVLLGATLVADRFELECEDLRSYLAAEAACGPVFDDAGATGAQVAAYLASSRRRAGAEDGTPRPRVYVMEEGDNLIISGLPGPAHEDAEDEWP
jgi:hypothetical protein